MLSSTINAAPRAVAGLVRQTRCLVLGRAKAMHPAWTTPSWKIDSACLRSYVQPTKFYCMPIQTIDVREIDVSNDDFKA
jgi:hypothetical protein